MKSINEIITNLKSAFLKVFRKKMVRYNVIWAFLIFLFFIYLKIDSSIANKTGVDEVESVINGYDDVNEKLSKLNQITDGTEFEISKFPFTKKYTVTANHDIENLNRRYSNVGSLNIQDNQLVYKTDDTTFAVYNLNNDSWVRKRLLTADNKAFAFVQLPVGGSSVIYFSQQNRTEEIRDKVATYYYLDQQDSSLKKTYFKAAAFYSNFIEDSYRNFLLTENSLYYYNDTACLVNPLRDAYEDSKLQRIEKLILAKGKIINVLPIDDEIYVLATTPSGSDLSFFKFNEDYLSGNDLNNQTAPKSLRFKNGVIDSGFNWENTKQVLHYPVKGLNLKNTKVAAADANSKAYLSIISSIADSNYVSLIRLDNGKPEIVGQGKFPKSDFDNSNYYKLELISKKSTFWVTYHGQPIYKFALKNPKGPKLSDNYDATVVNTEPNENVYTKSTWFSENDYCSLLPGQNTARLVFSSSKQHIFTTTNDDLGQLQLLKNFTFFSLSERKRTGFYWSKQF